MAVDTRSRRASVLGFAQPYNLTLPLSDGTVGSADWAHCAYSYPGVAADTPPAFGGGLRMMLLGVGCWLLAMLLPL